MQLGFDFFYRFIRPPVLVATFGALGGLPLLVQAQDQAPAQSQSPEVSTENWNAKFQSTYVWQNKPAFYAAYSGGNSLSPSKDDSYSFTATAFLGWRPWAGGELYFDPEAAQGVAFSNLTGLGGLTNGELAKTAGPRLKVYRARLFLRQTWGQGGGQEAVASGQNQLAGYVDKNRWVLTLGNLSVLDVFDTNAYSRDPRNKFMNWDFMANGPYDYAADARGYTWGGALEWYYGDWAVRAGRFAQPYEPNQMQLDPHIFKHYGDQLEIEHAHTLGGQPGKLRFLAFRNRAVMASYQDALNLAAQTNTTPDLNAVRNSAQNKVGVGLNAEQAISDDVGVFASAGWADGKTGIYAFTDIDRSLAGGLLIKGSAWGRGQDSVGLALAQNNLSSVHRQYLAAGGLSSFIGDGALNYRPELVFETFYSMNVAKNVWLTLDWQQIHNPAYNADRGPVGISSVRLHTEF